MIYDKELEFLENESKQIENTALERQREFIKKNPMAQNFEISPLDKFMYAEEISRLQDVESQIARLKNKARGIFSQQDIKDIVKLHRILSKRGIEYSLNASKIELIDLYTKSNQLNEEGNL